MEKSHLTWDNVMVHDVKQPSRVEVFSISDATIQIKP